MRVCQLIFASHSGFFHSLGLKADMKLPQECLCTSIAPCQQVHVQLPQANIKSTVIAVSKHMLGSLIENW